jgi:hypothetical protein
MAHEKSITVTTRKPKGGNRWFVVDNSGADKGRILGPKKGFATMAAANKFAKARSENFNPNPTKTGPQPRGRRKSRIRK